MPNPRIAYDRLYGQMNMHDRPFGYSKDYFIWRASKIKGEISKFVKKGLILDIGGGFGIMANFLPPSTLDNYINLDISIVMLRYSPHVNICAAGEHLPFRDGIFDYVICSGALECVYDKLLVLKESYRVLKSGGLLLLTTPRTGWIDDFRQSPFVVFILVDWFINSFILKTKRRGGSPTPLPEGLKYEPSSEKWLKETIERIGFRVLRQWRADNHVPWCKNGESKFWRWFADRFVDPRKFGQSTCLVCSK